MIRTLAILLTLVSSGALGQTWPTRGVTIVVGYAPGGGTDVLARILAKYLAEPLGQSVTVENVAGAGGMLGSARVAKAPPDGYQIVVGTRADAINQTLYKKPLYDLRTDLVPVVMIADQPNILLARKDLPVDGLQEFIAHVRKNQSTMTYASAGLGSTGHIDCALLNAAIGVNVTHVPYRGGGPAMQDLIAGRVDYICTLSATAVPQIEGNRLKGIAVMTQERAPFLPNLRGMREQGMPEMDASTWFGLFVPKGTPDTIVRRLRDATAATLDIKALQDQLLAAGAIVVPTERRSTEFLRKYVPVEIEKNGAPIRAAGIQIE